MRLVENKDFIMVWDNAFPDDLCDTAIEHFEYAKTLGLTYSRQAVEKIPSVAKKDDTYFPIDENVEELQVSNSKIFGTLKIVLNGAVDEYIREYSSMVGMQLMFHTFRQQKTPIGGGYHAWHHERGTIENSTRALAAILYLNDVDEGGETEFLYYPKRVKPKKGRLILWPSGFTHTHRGNPPISNEKHIIATWGNLAS